MMLRYVWQKEIDKHLVLVDFQMGFSTGRKKKLIIHVPIQTILGFFVCCVLYGWKDGYQPFFSLYHYPFPIRRVGGQEMSQKQDVQASSTFLGLSRRGHETMVFQPTFLLQVTFLDQIFSSSFTYMKKRDVHLTSTRQKMEDILNSSMWSALSKRYEKSA